MGQHSSVVAACASRTALVLFGEVLQALELPAGDMAAAAQAVARAALFALHWGFAALPLGMGTRQAVEGAIQDAAWAAGAEGVLPVEGVGLGEVLLQPQGGEWCRWGDALEAFQASYRHTWGQKALEG